MAIYFTGILSAALIGGVIGGIFLARWWKKTRQSYHVAQNNLSRNYRYEPNVIPMTRFVINDNFAFTSDHCIVVSRNSSSVL